MQTPVGGEIAEVQLLQLFLEVNADIDTQFQVWISITFAVLVATFVAGDRLSRGARFVLAALYMCAAGVLLLRYVRAGSYLPYVLDLYGSYGVTAPAALGISPTAGALRMLLFTIGSSLAAVSVLFPQMWRLRASVVSGDRRHEPPGVQPRGDPT